MHGTTPWETGTWWTICEANVKRSYILPIVPGGRTTTGLNSRGPAGADLLSGAGVLRGLRAQIHKRKTIATKEGRQNASYTYDDFISAANQAGLLQEFSQADLDTAQRYPEFGMSFWA